MQAPVCADTALKTFLINIETTFFFLKWWSKYQVEFQMVETCTILKVDSHLCDSCSFTTVLTTVWKLLIFSLMQSNAAKPLLPSRALKLLVWSSYPSLWGSRLHPCPSSGRRPAGWRCSQLPSAAASEKDLMQEAHAIDLIWSRRKVIMELLRLIAKRETL